MITARNLKQTIVWWSKTGREGFGKPEVGDPIEVLGRWEPTQRKITSSKGEEVSVQAGVFLDRDVEIGDWLYEGTLSGLSSGEEASPFSFAKEVVSFEKIPDIKGTSYVRKVWVK